MKIITCDIDGVLNDYPLCWIKYVNNELSADFLTKEEIKSTIGHSDYDNIKDKYRWSEFKANLKCNRNMVNVLQLLKKQGYLIMIVTSRPIGNKMKYPLLEDLTLNWLKKNRIPCDKLYYKFDDALFNELEENEIVLHIDDEIDQGYAFSNKQIPTLVIGPDKKAQLSNNLFIVSISDCIYTYIKSLLNDKGVK
ncbi:hypothetical protein RJ53_01005 [Methanocalculus chunghsingensis]|uniref:Nucleotidase n=1 Tax=Methanocalculus chunghsingensis TaxID=156457 RepID=A0A8J7W4J9_9EURY|nr:hypothetical protein [Methanocalculus chunghsingensis]MBR1368144.1 hypothetical protein [Methanocalculus chunghsingensis]